MVAFRGYSASSARGDEPSGPEPLGWRGFRSCLFCGREDTDWQHDLDRALVAFRTRFDRGHTWASTQVLCDGCEQRYRRGDYLALSRLRADLDPGGRVDGARSLLVLDELIALAAFCRADLRVRPLATPDFPDGFQPVDEHTGAEWVTEVWPPEFRRSVAEARPGHLAHDPGARISLLRSPWPSLTLAEAFAVLWTWAERDWGATTHEGASPGAFSSDLGAERMADERGREGEISAQQRARVVEALAWTDAQAVAWLTLREEPPT